MSNQESGSIDRQLLTVLKIFKVIRVIRLIKLVKKIKSLHKIIETIIYAVPSITNIGCILVLIYFVFAVIGNYLFKEITEGPNLTKYVNFENFGTSIFTLFTASTGLNWWKVMFDLSYTNSDCIEE